MPRDVINPKNYMKGEVRVHRVGERPIDRANRVLATKTVEPFRVVTPGTPAGWFPATGFAHNDFLYEWGALFGNLLLRRGLNYGIGGMYIEFENTASPGDPVAPATFTRDPEEGVDYYNGLAVSADRDYLRVPLVSGTMDSSDTSLFPKGNRPTFFAQTQGVTGVHGKTFSDAANSTVFGGALVAFVDETDFTRDLVLSRFYLTVDTQQVKLATSQIGFEWRLLLG